MNDFQEQAKNWLRNVVKQNPDKIKAGVEKAGDLIDKQTGGKYAEKVDAVQQKVGTYVDSQSATQRNRGTPGRRRGGESSRRRAEEPQSSEPVKPAGCLTAAGAGGDPEARREVWAETLLTRRPNRPARPAHAPRAPKPVAPSRPAAEAPTSRHADPRAGYLARVRRPREDLDVKSTRRKRARCSSRATLGSVIDSGDG